MLIAQAAIALRIGRFDAKGLLVLQVEVETLPSLTKRQDRSVNQLQSHFESEECRDQIVT